MIILHYLPLTDVDRCCHYTDWHSVITALVTNVLTLVSKNSWLVRLTHHITQMTSSHKQIIILLQNITVHHSTMLNHQHAYARPNDCSSLLRTLTKPLIFHQKIVHFLSAVHKSSEMLSLCHMSIIFQQEIDFVNNSLTAARRVQFRVLGKVRQFVSNAGY